MSHPVIRLFHRMSSSRFSSRKKPRLSGRPRLSRLAIEFLEDRLAPAIFNVNSLADILNPPSGTVTLRSAIQAANMTPGDNTINLTVAGTYKVTLTGSNDEDNSGGDFDILGKAGGGNLTIQNTSSGAVVVDGNGLDRVFDINPTQLFTANLSGSQEVPPTSSPATGTASILVHSGQDVITVSGSYNGLQGQPTAFQVREAPAGANGPLATDANGNSMQLTNLPASTSGNAGPQDFPVNGAFLNQLMAGKFYANIPTTAFGNGEIRGQFVAVDPQFSVTMTGFTITGGNTPAAEFGPGSGGGIEDQGNVNLTLNNMVVTGNTAHDDGGGIAMWDDVNASWTLTINNSTISNNNAAFDFGGGIFANGTGKINIAGSVISGNQAYNQGGGIRLDSIGPNTADLTIDSTVLSNNNAFSVVGSGGAIGNDGSGTVSISNSTVQKNSAGSAGGGYADTRGLGTLNVLNSLFSANTAVGNGGGIAAGGPMTSITNSEIDGNTSGGSGGGVFANGASLTIQSSTFANNTASGSGGGLEVATTGTGSTITNATLTSNRATNAGATGGGIDAGAGFTGSLGLLNDTVNDNSANTGGGLFWAAATGSQVLVENTILAENSAGTGPDASNPANAFTDQGGNLIGISGAGSGNTGFTAASTQRGTTSSPLKPKLGPLQNNGGPTIGAPPNTQTLQTEEPLPGSPAIGNGILTGAPATDERGFPSGVANGKVNVGAVGPDLGVTGINIQATEGQSFNGAVATFTGPTPANGTFSATIDWGDQTSPTTGTVTGSNGSYSISGQHTYAEDGQYKITVTVTQSGAGASRTASGTSMADVAENDLTGQVAPITLTEGQSFSGTVATFHDPGAAANDSFSATITWGDNSSSTGTISVNGGTYSVSGNHTYVDEGSFAVSVTVTEKGVRQSSSLTGNTAAVAEGDQLTGKVLTTLTAAKGQAFSGNVATFTDMYRASPAKDFTATITWGDNTSSTTGMVSGSNGSFTVAGSHTYTAQGSFTVSVTLTEMAPGSATATANGSITVSQSTPRGAHQDVLNALIALQKTITQKDDNNKLGEAIRKLNDALNPHLWVDDTHLASHDGQKVFDDDKDAVNKLLELYNSKHSSLYQSAALLADINTLVQADEQIASIAIMDAAAQDGDNDKIAEAKKKLAKGSSDFSAGKYNSALDQFKDAWRKAEEAMED